MNDLINGLYNIFVEGMSKGAGIDSKWVTMDMASLNGFASSFAGIAGNIALLLTTVYFLLEINMRLATESGNTPIRTWVGSILKYGIAAYLVGNGHNLTMNFLALANSLVSQANSVVIQAAPAVMPSAAGGGGYGGEGDAINGAFSVVGSTLTALMDAGPNFFAKFFACMFLGLGYAATWVCGIIWIYKSISYKIEFSFRVGLYPFALADAYQGNSSSAVRFLKSIVGMGLYGAAFIVIPKIGMGVMAEMLSKMITESDTAFAAGGALTGNPSSGLFIVVKGLFVALAVPAAEIGCLGICKQAIKEYLA